MKTEGKHTSLQHFLSGDMQCIAMGVEMMAAFPCIEAKSWSGTASRLVCLVCCMSSLRPWFTKDQDQTLGSLAISRLRSPLDQTRL